MLTNQSEQTDRQNYTEVYAWGSKYLFLELKIRSLNFNLMQVIVMDNWVYHQKDIELITAVLNSAVSISLLNKFHAEKNIHV
jgi:hypothetical protein